MNLLFDEALHRYTLDGEEIPGVTRVLDDMGMNDTQWFRDHHRRRGTAVHKACELAAQGCLDLDNTHEMILPYARQFLLWQERVNYHPLLMEEALASSHWQFAGKLDHFGLIDWEGGRERCLIDVKSGQVPPSVYHQLHLYYHLLRENHPDLLGDNRILMASLQLTPTQYRFRVLEYDENFSQLDGAIGLSLVRAWHFRKRHKLLKGQQ